MPMPLLLLFSFVQATAAVGPSPNADREPLFVSPMGEPFRGDAGGRPEERWFAGADLNHDGTITRDEFERDAERFFLLLDRRHDGEIDPDDIDYYETVMLPEVRVGGGARSGRPDGGGGRRGGGYRGGGRRRHGSGGEGHRAANDDGGTGATLDESRLGAARFSWFDLPEPVTPADTDFNRGISEAEFRTAADVRFAALDLDHDGVLRRGELPPAPRRHGRG